MSDSRFGQMESLSFSALWPVDTEMTIAVGRDARNLQDPNRFASVDDRAITFIAVSRA